MTQTTSAGNTCPGPRLVTVTASSSRTASEVGASASSTRSTSCTTSLPDRRFGPPGLSLEGANETADLVHLLRKPGPGRRRRATPGEEAADHLVERPDPIAGGPVSLQPGAHGEHLLAPGDEAPEKVRLVRAGLEPAGPGRTRHHAFKELVRIGKRVAEEETPEPLAPRVIPGRGEPFRGAVLRIHPPADPGVAHPAADGGKVRLGDAESGAHRLRVEGGEHRLRAEAGAPQGQELEERADRRRRGGAPARHAERYARRRAEHRFHGRAVDIEARREDENVGGTDTGVGIEEPEEAVVQDLGLAHRRVADVDPEGVVARPAAAGRRAGLGRPPLGRETEIEHVPLDGSEPVRPVRRREVLLPVVARDLHERIEGVATGPPPRGKELVALGEVPFGGVHPVRPPGDLAPRVDVAPSTRGTD